MPSISDKHTEKVDTLYNEENKSMQEIADTLNVSLNAVVYFMRKHDIKRRSAKEANEVMFGKKDPTFTVKENLSREGEVLKAIGAMLYWAEGYKTEKSNIVDFANSDPQMVKLFLHFLREIYDIKEEKLRAYLYCYPNQDINELKSFWSKITDIPKEQFTKPYVRENYRDDGRKMKNGLIHIRYGDKKLLREILNLIESYTV